MTDKEPKPVATMYVTPDRHRVIHAEILDYSQLPDDDEWFDVYTAPQKKEWVGLTKEEARKICVATVPYVVDMAAAIEAKLKEKNT
jgi:hypothetical protein